MRIIELKDKDSGREEHDDLQIVSGVVGSVPQNESVTIDEMERCLNLLKKVRAASDSASPMFRKLVVEEDEWEFLKRRINAMKWRVIHADFVACRNAIRDAATITPEQIKQL